VQVRYSGVCHTDLHMMHGDWPLKATPPYVGGHEGAGVVVARGAQVTGLAVGDLAGIKWLNGSCLRCGFCTAGDEPLCAQALLSGATVDGTFQQYAVAKAAHAARLPPGCDLAAVAPVLCAGITVYKGLRESGARAGQCVAVVGAAGGLGSMALQYAKAMGLRPLAVDLGGDAEEKARVCTGLGAIAYVDVGGRSSDEVVKAVRAAATPDGLGPHAVLLLSTHEEPFRQATSYVRSRGSVVCIGMPANATVTADVFDLVVRMVTVKGSYVGNRQDSAEAIDFFLRGLVKAPVKVVPLRELPDIYRRMEEGAVVGRYVVDMVADLV
jgi:propanol-preferring alcohol dehydrogenase